MAWIIIEGLDRTGKSTLADIYKKRGFDIVHLSAPDKKFTTAGYAGPSYLDEIIDLYMKHNSRDVVFDRSAYGEFVWPLVYGRKAQLSEEDMDIIREIEDNNQTERILMYDADAESHWKRCVANKEPLNKNQFNNANVFFDRIATKYSFQKMTLDDITSGKINFVAHELTQKEKDEIKNSTTTTTSSANSTTVVTINSNKAPIKAGKTPEQLKLEKANVINEVLSKKILKKSGGHYDEIEKEVREHLNNKLGDLLGNKMTPSKDGVNFSVEEVKLLKAYVEVIKQKMVAPKDNRR
jgi:thymidylate kinase